VREIEVVADAKGTGVGVVAAHERIMKEVAVGLCEHGAELRDKC
jgi:hypothetical protein